MLNEGDRLADRYRLEQELGRGAHGVVFRAHDEGLDRPVAVKQLLTASPTTLARFLQEGRVIASLSHEAIVGVYDLLLDQDPPCLVLEWVPGESLGELLERDGPVPSTEARRLMRSLAEALDHAHRYGVLHRDVKPDNVLLDAQGVPKLTDFGLAKPHAVPDIQDTGELQLDTDLRASLTSANGLVGTPSYMSPEQARGDTARIGPWSDVYALGATIYEALTGSPPFVRSSLLELIVALQSLQVEPPSKRTRRPIDPELEGVVLRCLARDPDDRPTAGEVSASLRRLAGSQRLAAGASTSRRIEPARRWWPAAAVAGVGLVGVVLGVAVTRTSTPPAVAKATQEPAPTEGSSEEAPEREPKPESDGAHRPTRSPSATPSTERTTSAPSPSPVARTSTPEPAPSPSPDSPPERKPVPKPKPKPKPRGPVWTTEMRARLLPRRGVPPGWLERLVRGKQFARTWARSWGSARREALARGARVVAYLSLGDDAWLPAVGTPVPGDAVPVYARAEPHEDPERCPVMRLPCAYHVRAWELIVKVPPREATILVCTSDGHIANTHGAGETPAVPGAAVARKDFKYWGRQVHLAPKRLGSDKVVETLKTLAMAVELAVPPIDGWARATLRKHAKVLRAGLLRAQLRDLERMRRGLRGIPELEVAWQAATLARRNKRAPKAKEVRKLERLLGPIGAEPHAGDPPQQSHFVIRERKRGVIGYGTVTLTLHKDGATTALLDRHWRGSRNEMRTYRDRFKLGRYYELTEWTRTATPSRTIKVTPAGYGFDYSWSPAGTASPLRRSCEVDAPFWEHGSMLSAMLLARRAPAKTERYSLRALRWPTLTVTPSQKVLVTAGTYPPRYARAILSVRARKGAVTRIELTYAKRGWTVQVGSSGTWTRVSRRGVPLTMEFVSKSKMEMVRSKVRVTRGRGTRKDR